MPVAACQLPRSICNGQHDGRCGAGWLATACAGCLLTAAHATGPTQAMQTNSLHRHALVVCPPYCLQAVPGQNASQWALGAQVVPVPCVCSRRRNSATGRCRHARRSSGLGAAAAWQWHSNGGSSHRTTAAGMQLEACCLAWLPQRLCCTHPVHKPAWHACVFPERAGSSLCVSLRRAPVTAPQHYMRMQPPHCHASYI